MKAFTNPVGSGTLWFHNLTTAEGTPVAYDPQARAFLPMPPFCANREVIGCNWIAPEEGAFCRSCAMTALAPAPEIPNAISNWAETEAARPTRFNPRATRPRGARLGVSVKTVYKWMFQSTRPRGARPFLLELRFQLLGVSIHAPARGAT
jgi:hypothetical protein